MYTENGGVFACKTKHLKLTGGNKNPSSGITHGFMSPRIQSPMHASGGRSNRGGGIGGRGGRGGMNRVTRDREILGKTIKITGGPYKGAVGIIKDATECTARVELHSSCQTISVDRNHISVVGMSVKDGSLSVSTRTPSGRTPAVFNTPTYIGSKTPVHGSQTPQYHMDGSRTPYGAMTPVQDGSMTPRHGSWNPSSSPPRSNDYTDYTEASPSFTPSTPNTPYAPHTPGASFIEYNSYQSSPGSLYQHNYIGTPSPSVYSPATPGPPHSPFNPQTPGSNLDQHVGGDWCTSDMVVKIVHHKDKSLLGRTGIIKTVTNQHCTMYIHNEDRMMTMSSDCLEPVTPDVGDSFKVVCGEDRESTGKVLRTIDYQDAMVLINDREELRNLKTLCKLEIY